jgi:hypothetical protein
MGGDVMSSGVFFPSFKDSCVIEEQDDHLVLAVRIPKVTINSNMALLAVLSDLASASTWSLRSAAVSTSPTVPAAPTVQRKFKARTKALIGAAVFLVGMFGAPQLVPTPGFASDCSDGGEYAIPHNQLTFRVE